MKAWGRGIELLAALALAGVTLAATLSMARLFDGASWMAPALVHAVAAHAVATGLRLRGVRLPAAAVLTAAAAALAVSWVTYPGTTLLGLPTPDTWEAARTDLQAAWSTFGDVVAPAPVEPGFTVTLSLALWFVGFVADWAAFRLLVPFEATLPAGTLFVFASLLGTARGRGWSTVLFAGTLLVFLLVHRTSRQGTTAHWVAGRQRQGERALVASGALLALVAVVGGVVVGPRLPGAQADAVIDVRDLDDDGPDSRITVSPLVDIRSRLVEQSRTEVFSVRATERANWRLTSLDRFDGRIWSSSGSYGRAEGELEQAVAVDVDTTVLAQVYSVTALAAIWLPAAYEPRAIDPGEAEVRYDEASGTLIVDNHINTSDGLVYRVESAVANHTPESLRATDPSVPSAVAERALALPDGFSAQVTSLAESIVRGAPTRYDAAIALQDHLRSFTYDLQVQPGHGTDDLERFLFETRRGYCEQFAGAFAAMARAVGIPARVAVGFTTGEQDPADPQVFHVRGSHAHAWPEVYFEGAGWVAFEPTPGRGAPRAEAYTGVPETQVDGTGGGLASTTVPPTSAPAGEEPGPATDPTTPTRDPELGELPPLEPGTDGRSAESLAARWWPRLAWATAVVAVLAVAYVVAVPLIDRRRRTRRRRGAVTPTATVRVAWAESIESLALLDVHPAAAHTHTEVARLVLDRVPAAGPPVRTLARLAETADYSPEGSPPPDAETATQAAAEVDRVVREGTTPGYRLRRALDPRRWWRSRPTGSAEPTA